MSRTLRGKYDVVFNEIAHRRHCSRRHAGRIRLFRRKKSDDDHPLKACEAAIQDTQEARAGNPDLGPKSAAVFDSLLELAAQRCKDGEYQYADDLLIVARGMVASE
tara:strand:+ start:317 stop:634 length:318 start_codon:yes stop_codon:yes gene_type:complete